MSNTARAMVVVAAGTLAAAALTGCGGGTSSKAAAAAAPTTATGTTPASTAPATTPTPTAKPTYLVVNGLKEATLKADLPTPADLGVPSSGYDTPVASEQDSAADSPQLPVAASISCDSLYRAGSSDDARSGADEFIAPSQTSDATATYYAAGRQYDVGGGAMLLQQLEKQVHDPACATSTSTTAKGTVVNHRVTVKAQSGLGNQADLIRDQRTYTSTGNIVEIDTLVVRYGDAVVVVSHEDLQDQVQHYNLAGKAKAYAAKLGLR